MELAVATATATASEIIPFHCSNLLFEFERCSIQNHCCLTVSVARHFLDKIFRGGLHDKVPVSL